MANMNFNDYAPKKTTGNFPERVKVGYFNSLRDDGDEAIVRLNYDTKADFKVTTVHRVVIDGNWRNISCLKGAYDTDEVCPLCASGNKVLTKVFVQMLDYVMNEQGKLVATPKVWERPYGFIQDVLDAIKDGIEDGFTTPTTPIRDIVFKVRRVGAKGDIKTKYKIKVCNPTIFPEATYVKDFSRFKDFDVAHHSYTNRTAEEMKVFIETGKFPERVKEAKPATKEAPKTEVVAEAVLSVKEELPTHPGVAESIEAFEAPVVETPKTAPATTPAATPATNKPHRYAF